MKHNYQQGRACRYDLPCPASAGPSEDDFAPPTLLVVVVCILLWFCSAAHASCVSIDLNHDAIKAEVADTPVLRSQGLMHRRQLASRAGMWFVMDKNSTSAFWMRNTYIPLDIVFIDRMYRVVHVHPHARPHDETPIGSPTPYDYVLEVPAGTAKRFGICVGDTINQAPISCSS